LYNRKPVPGCHTQTPLSSVNRRNSGFGIGQSLPAIKAIATKATTMIQAPIIRFAPFSSEDAEHSISGKVT
jgi:hypothetical protein